MLEGLHVLLIVISERSLGVSGADTKSQKGRPFFIAGATVSLITVTEDFVFNTSESHLAAASSTASS